MLSLFRRSSDEDIIKDHGAENVVTICGTSGFGSAEDTLFVSIRQHLQAVDSLSDFFTNFTLNDYNNDLVHPWLLKMLLNTNKEFVFTIYKVIFQVYEGTIAAICKPILNA